MSFAFHIYIFNLSWNNKKLVYALRVKAVVTVSGESRAVTERGMREASEMPVMFLDLGAVYTVEFRS